MRARKAPTPPPMGQVKPPPPPPKRSSSGGQVVKASFSSASCSMYSTAPTRCLLCGVAIPPKTLHECSRNGPA